MQLAAWQDNVTSATTGLEQLEAERVAGLLPREGLTCPLAHVELDGPPSLLTARLPWRGQRRAGITAGCDALVATQQTMAGDVQTLLGGLAFYQSLDPGAWVLRVHTCGAHQARTWASRLCA